jgi:SAM-dependent methyltransferase
MRALLLRASKKLSRKNLHEFLRRELAALPDGSLILNVGAGGEIKNVINEVAARKNFDVVSADIASERNPDCLTDISQSSFSDATFDAVVIMEVLEHIPEPQRAAFEIERILRARGTLILSTPFIFPLHDRPRDFYRYTKYGLAHLFARFDRVAIQPRNSWAEAILVLMTRMAGEPGRSAGLAALVLVPLALLLVPLAVLAARIAPTDFMTTGYTLTAIKREPIAPERC